MERRGGVPVLGLGAADRTGVGSVGRPPTPRVVDVARPSRVVLFLPATLVPEALTEAHGELLTGHDGIYKTKL